MKQQNQSATPKIQFALYILLLIVTPFVLVRKYMVGVVYGLSHWSFALFGMNIPVVALVSVLVALGLAYWKRRSIKRQSLIGMAVVLAMVFFSHLIQDAYSLLTIYDLQRNWHYIAFAIYIYIFYQCFQDYQNNWAKGILVAFFSAFLISMLDETFQFFLSHRVFDVSDIAKDAWGACMGLVLYFTVGHPSGVRLQVLRPVMPESFQDVRSVPWTTLLFVGVFAFTMLVVSPLLSAHEYMMEFFLIWLALLIIGWVVLFSVKKKVFRIVFLSFAVGIVLYIGLCMTFFTKAGMSAPIKNLLVYRNIPIPYFDAQINKFGCVRLMDKKTVFNDKDRNYLLSLQSKIVIIGMGWENSTDVDLKKGTLFYFNPYIEDGTQFIFLSTPEACMVYNQLMLEGKSVVLVAHNSH